MRILSSIAAIALAAGIVTTILYFTGTVVVAPLALVCGFIALASGLTAEMWHLQQWGVPGDRD